MSVENQLLSETKAELEEQLRRMKWLNQLQTLLFDAHRNRERFFDAMKLLYDEFQASGIHIFSIEEKEEKGVPYFRYMFEYNDKEQIDYTEQERTPVKGMPEWYSIFAEGRIVDMPDVRAMWAHFADGEKNWLDDKQIMGGVVVPLAYSNGKLMGVMGIIDSDKHSYSQHFLNMIALAFSNAIEDMEARNLLEQQMLESARAKKAAEEASEIKSRFLANMSHEIRTPMNAVIGMAEIALQEKLPERAEESILQIRDSGEHLLSIINDILDFSKLESGKMSIFNDNYQMVKVLNDLENIIRPRVAAKNLDFIIEFDPDIPEVLFGDANRIRQVLLNLVNNAVKFTDTGRVVLRVNLVERQAESVVLRFEVEDTGCGIHKEDIQRLFDAFEQIDKQKQKNIEGTGLGLAISSQLIQLMESTLNVESEFGKGSIFYFELKQRIINELPSGEYRYTAVAEKQEKHILFTAPRAKILLVDDVELNLVVAKGLMAQFDMQIDVAYNGLQALEKVAKQHYHIVFMDHMMPEMDGIEATRKIRQMSGEYFRKLPIIALSANAIKEAQELFKDAGMDDFVSKPIILRDLVHALVTWLPREVIEITDEEMISVDELWNEDIQKLSEMLDVTVVKKYFSGKIKVYLSALQKYMNDGFEKIKKIEMARTQQDWESYTIQLHSLKSSSATIGATELSNMAKELELAGTVKAVDYINAHTEQALEHFRYLLAGLKEITDSIQKNTISGKQTLPEIEPAQLTEQLSELRACVYTARFDSAEEILNDLNKYMHDGRLLKEFTVKIKKMMDEFQIDEAVDLIDTYLKKD